MSSETPAPRPTKLRRALTVGAGVLGVILLTDGMVIAFGDETSPSPTPSPSAVGRNVIEIDLKAPTRPPVLKPAAQAATAAGATAFVRFWFDTLNYSLAHNDDQLLVHHTNAGCALCSAYLINIIDWRTKQYKLAGGLTVPVALAIGPFSATDPVPFLATFVTSPGTLTRAGGAVANYAGGRTRGQLTVLYSSGRWQMTDVVIDARGASPQPSASPTPKGKP